MNKFQGMERLIKIGVLNHLDLDHKNKDHYQIFTLTLLLRKWYQVSHSTLSLFAFIVYRWRSFHFSNQLLNDHLKYFMCYSLTIIYTKYFLGNLITLSSNSSFQSNILKKEFRNHLSLICTFFKSFRDRQSLINFFRV